MGITLLNGDCLDVMRGLETNSVDSIVTDPPYGLSFMGKKWDYEVPSVAIWEEALRVLKPGGFLLSFSGTRTYHRMVVNIEDAGFEIRDQLGWLYGSGMPKTMDLGKAVHAIDPTLNYEGWGTALKPAFEPICMARKPFKGTLTKNVIEHGVGGLNIDASRVPGENPSIARRESARKSGNAPSHPTEYTHTINDRTSPEVYMAERSAELLGRFPSNILHDGSQEVVDALPEGVSRFFYHAKAGKSDRDGSTHPTVKPVALMAYLVNMVTPKGGLTLDPFAGSGTTGQGALDVGANAVLIERDESYFSFLQDRFVLFSDT